MAGDAESSKDVEMKEAGDKGEPAKSGPKLAAVCAAILPSVLMLSDFVVHNVGWENLVWNIFSLYSLGKQP